MKELTVKVTVCVTEGGERCDPLCEFSSEDGLCSLFDLYREQTDRTHADYYRCRSCLAGERKAKEKV